MLPLLFRTVWPRKESVIFPSSDWNGEDKKGGNEKWKGNSFISSDSGTNDFPSSNTNTISPRCTMLWTRCAAHPHQYVDSVYIVIISYTYIPASHAHTWTHTQAHAQAHAHTHQQAQWEMIDNSASENAASRVEWTVRLDVQYERCALPLCNNVWQIGILRTEQEGFLLLLISSGQFIKWHLVIFTLHSLLSLLILVHANWRVIHFQHLLFVNRPADNYTRQSCSWMKVLFPCDRAGPKNEWWLWPLISINLLFADSRSKTKTVIVSILLGTVLVKRKPHVNSQHITTTTLALNYTQ